MNYIYDILLNFNEQFFDFYDWNLTDDIIEVRKIPIFRVDNKTYNDLFSKSFKLDSDFLDKVKNKCEVYSGKKTNRITAFLITDMENIIAFKIDKSLFISSLQVDDELDILDELNIKTTFIKYKVKGKKMNQCLKTRNQIENESFVNKLLTNLFKENNISKIKYIYYECFNKKESNIDIIKKNLLELSNNGEMISKLYNILMSISTINN